MQKPDRLRNGRPVVLVVIPEELRARLFTPHAWQKLKNLAEVQVAPNGRLDDASTSNMLSRADILVTGWGTESAGSAWMERAPQLSAVVHTAGSVRHLLDESIFERGIEVSSQAENNGRPVAEYTLAMTLLSVKQVFRAENAYRSTRQGVDIEHLVAGGGGYGSGVGIVGGSRIGRRVLRLLEPFDFVRMVSDPFMDPHDAATLGAKLMPIDELFEASHVVSLHAPLLDSTRGMIGADLLSRLPDGATFINTSRGALVDQDALVLELVSGRINAVLDVTEPEVVPEASPLWSLPNVVLTPHIAGSLGNEVRRLGESSVEEVVRILSGEPLLYGVSKAQYAVMA